MLVVWKLVDVRYLVSLGVLDYQFSLAKVIDEDREVAVAPLVVRFSKSLFCEINLLNVPTWIQNVSCLQEYRLVTLWDRTWLELKVIMVCTNNILLFWRNRRLFFRDSHVGMQSFWHSIVIGMQSSWISIVVVWRIILIIHDFSVLVTLHNDVLAGIEIVVSYSYLSFQVSGMEAECGGSIVLYL